MSTPTEQPTVLWEPTDEQVERATMTRFSRWVADTRGVDVAGDYDALWRWSVDDLEAFWAAIWEFFDVAVREPLRAGARLARDAGRASGSRARRLSYAEHIFRGRDDDAVAIRHASELRELGEWTWGELRAQTARDRGRPARARRRQGDRVVAVHAEHPRDDRGVPGRARRSARSGRAARPTSARAAWSTASRRSSRRCCSPSTATATAARTSTAARPSRGSQGEIDRCRRRSCCRTSTPRRTSAGSTRDDVGRAGRGRGRGRARRSSSCPFDHPLWVLYSSGTTGLPKPIVHGQGGILLEHLKKMHLHLDAQAGDRVFWFTTTGWMMWNFLVGVPADAGVDRALRRQPRLARPGRAVGPRRGGRDHELRHERRASSRRA